MKFPESPYTLPVVSLEDLHCMPNALSTLDESVARPEVDYHYPACPFCILTLLLKALSTRVEADVKLISSALQLTCEQETVINPKVDFFVLMLMTVMRGHGAHITTW